MTEDELAEIEARAEAATPEPWDVQKCYGDRWTDRTGQHHTAAYWIPKAEQLGDGECGAMLEMDARFIAAARSDIPRLVAEVRRLTRGG